MVTNFEPKNPFEEYLLTFGCWFCNWPANIHSCAVKKCVSMPRICFTVPLAGSSLIKSVNIQPIFLSPKAAANSSTSRACSSSNSFIESLELFCGGS